MNNTNSISLAEIENKYDSLDHEIEKIQKEKSHLQYVIDNFFQKPLSNSKLPQESPVISTHSFNSDLSTRDLIIEILRHEKSKMTHSQIFEIFTKVKPKITPGGFRVKLSKISSKGDHQILREGNRYYYEEKLEE